MSAAIPLADRRIYDDVAAIAARHGLTVDDLVSPSRNYKASQARAEVWRHLRATTAMSLPELGALFGRHHTTVLYAVSDAYRKRHAQRSADRWRRRTRPLAASVASVRAVMRAI